MTTMVTRQLLGEIVLLPRNVKDVERPGTKKPTVPVRRAADIRARKGSQSTIKETAIIAVSRVIKRPNIGRNTPN